MVIPFRLAVVAALAGEALALAAAYLAPPPAVAQEKPPDPAAQRATPELLKSDVGVELLLQLSPESRKAFAEMLQRDWQNRPEWGDMAIALLRGESIRPGMGWWRPAAKRYDFAWLTARYDADKDGRLVANELPPQLSDAALLFERLDRDFDGVLRPEDFDWFTAPPNPQANPQQTMAEFLFVELDADTNGRVSADELEEFFRLADQGKQGFLTPEDLVKRLAGKRAESQPPSQRSPEARLLRMFFNGDAGTFESGPDLNDAAPDFELPTHDGSRTIRLSACRGQRPVVLIFGSFT